MITGIRQYVQRLPYPTSPHSMILTGAALTIAYCIYELIMTIKKQSNQIRSLDALNSAIINIEQNTRDKLSNSICREDSQAKEIDSLKKEILCLKENAETLQAALERAKAGTLTLRRGSRFRKKQESPSTESPDRSLNQCSEPSPAKKRKIRESDDQSLSQVDLTTKPPTPQKEKVDAAIQRLRYWSQPTQDTPTKTPSSPTQTWGVSAGSGSTLNETGVTEKTTPHSHGEDGS